MDYPDTFIQAQQALKRTSLSMMDVARDTGLGYGTVRSIKEGRGNPTIRTLRAVIQSCQEAGK
jgi:DNA-binding phage protein